MSQTEEGYTTIKDEFFTKPLYPVENVSLKGSQCRDCKQTYLGPVVRCQNCFGENIDNDFTLSRTGTIYSYTISRHKPPGDFKGPLEPFEPYPVALVDLPEGARILSVLDCGIDEPKVGMEVELSVQKLYEDEEGKTVLTYKFCS